MKALFTVTLLFITVLLSGCLGSSSSSTAPTLAFLYVVGQGDNAIHAAGAMLARLTGYRPRRVEVDGCTYREGLQAVGISGGVAGNVVPDACEVQVNFRFAPDRSLAEAQQHVRDVLDG